MNVVKRDLKQDLERMKELEYNVCNGADAHIRAEARAELMELYIDNSREWLLRAVEAEDCVQELFRGFKDVLDIIGVDRDRYMEAIH